jgi:hypothetical protein
LVTRGHEGVEPRLVALLARDDEATQVRAAEALGRCGSVTAVEPLLACAERTSAFGGRAVRNAVQAAVAKIQSRLAGAEAGRVSVAGQAEVGAVSVAGRTEAGAVTVVGDSEAGAVRLARAASAGAVREKE